jgi:hypothetical protein
MPIIEHQIWDNIGASLEGRYREDQYFVHQRFVSDNPLDSTVVLPPTVNFFGTEVKHIFIVGIPFGWKTNDDGDWTFDWPPPRYDDFLSHHKETYKKFGKYKTYVYMDWIIVGKIMDANEDSDFENMMEQTEDKIEHDMCEQLKHHGFSFKGRINTEPPASEFWSIIDAFYGILPNR